MAQSDRPKASAPAAKPQSTFSGFPWPTKIAGPVLLALPLVLYMLDVASGQFCGVFYGGAFLLVSLAFACWPALESAESMRARLVIVAIAIAAAGAAGLPLARGLFPGTPAAKVNLTKSGARQALQAIGPGAYDLYVRADFEGGAAREIHASYTVRMLKGSKGLDVEGMFESTQTRGRVGRQAVQGFKKPREWNRHVIRVSDAAPEIELAKADGPLGLGLEVRLYADQPLWPFLAGAVVLALLAVGTSASFRGRDARDAFGGGVIAALCTGVLGSTWAWLGEPLLPLIGASFAGIVGGWLAAKILGRAARGLPWAAK